MDFEQIEHQGYLDWLFRYERKLFEADESVRPFLLLQIESCKRGWLRLAREATFHSTYRAAQKLQVSQPTWVKLEKSEENGSISLERLARAAEALDCELIYAIRPKRRRPFSELIWQRVKLHATPVFKKRFDRPSYRNRTMLGWVAPAYSAIVRDLMNSRKFLAQEGWTQIRSKRY